MANKKEIVQIDIRGILLLLLLKGLLVMNHKVKKLCIASTLCAIAVIGSMFGALLCGVAYWKTNHIPFTLIAEVFGTAILGGLCAYPVAILLMGINGADVAFYTYVVPFLISTVGGAILSAVLIGYLKKVGLLDKFMEI